MIHGAIKSANGNEALTRNGKPSELSDKELDEVSGGGKATSSVSREGSHPSISEITMSMVF
jgi:bacteriocin-like protein